MTNEAAVSRRDFLKTAAVASLATGGSTIMSMDHAFHVLEIMECCHISQQTGKRVPVHSTF
jgi:TAT (twin-arginine translocation) pathway signal sequence